MWAPSSSPRLREELAWDQHTASVESVPALLPPDTGEAVDIINVPDPENTTHTWLVISHQCQTEIPWHDQVH